MFCTFRCYLDAVAVCLRVSYRPDAVASLPLLRAWVAASEKACQRSWLFPRKIGCRTCKSNSTSTVSIVVLGSKLIGLYGLSLKIPFGGVPLVLVHLSHLPRSLGPLFKNFFRGPAPPHEKQMRFELLSSIAQLSERFCVFL